MGVLAVSIIIIGCSTPKKAASTVKTADQLYAELNNLFLQTSNQTQVKELPKDAAQIGTILVDGKNRPVMHSPSRRCVYFIYTKKDLNEDMKEWDQLLPIAEKKKIHSKTIKYGQLKPAKDGNFKLIVKISDEPLSKLNQKIAKVKKQFREACKSVRHQPLVYHGKTYKVYSDPTFKHFVITRPKESDPDDLENASKAMDQRCAQIAKSKGSSVESIEYGYPE
jgi:hypothetical protein